MTIGKAGREYLVELWDNVTSTRGVKPIERRLQKIGAITLRSPDSALGAMGYTARQITDKGRAERDAHVADTAARLSDTLRDVLEEANARPLLDVTKAGAPKMRLSVRTAYDRGLVCTSRQNGGPLVLRLTAYGCAVREAWNCAHEQLVVDEAGEVARDEVVDPYEGRYEG